jgi:hypothetical protein
MKHAASPKPAFTRELRVLIGLVCFGFFLIAFAPRLNRIGCKSDDECYQREHAARLMWVQISGGLFAIYGLWLAIRRMDQTKSDLARKEKEERVARYIRSMTMLGAMRDGNNRRKEPNIESRLGAVRALRALWLEASAEFEYILPTLNDYVAENLRRLPNSLDPGSHEESPPAAWRSFADGGLRPDVRVALLFLLEARYTLRLEKAFLDELDLRKAELAQAGFPRARLRNARLEGANLNCADFRFADLNSANLKEANLTGADFRGADLSNAAFDAADLSNAIFWLDEHDDNEQFLGIQPEMMVAASNWSSARFSPSFRNVLNSRAPEHSESFPQVVSDP